MLQDDASLPGVSSSNPSFSKACATFAVPLPGQSGSEPLSLDTMACTYNPASHSDWSQGNQSHAAFTSGALKQEPLSIPIQEQTMSLQTSSSSLLQHPPVYKTEKTDFNLVKQEQKGIVGGGGGKHPPLQSAYPPPGQAPPPQPSTAQKLSLDKYREKHATELAVSGHKHRLEQHGGVMDCDIKGEMLSSSSSSTYALSSMSQVDNRKHSQPHQTSHGGGGTLGNTPSPMKSKVPSSSTSGQDRRLPSEKRDKASLKVRLAVLGSGGGTQLDKSGQPGKEELKMKIKVASSERHSSSDEGIAANNKSKHSSPLVGKEKHRGVEHSLHRHHKHSHPHTHSGNGRGGPEGPGGGGGLLRGPPGLVSMEGALAPPVSASLSSSSSRKRAYPDASHNHHPPSSSTTSCSKVSKISKGGAGASGTSSFSSPCFPPCSSPVLQCVSSGLQLFG